MKLNAMLLGVFFLGLFALAGCGRLSGEQLGLLTAGAVAAKERASSFEVIRETISAADAKHADGVRRWAGQHSDGLFSQAKALSDLTEAVRLNNSLGDAARLQLALEAETAGARSENFDKILAYVKSTVGPDAFATWAADHSKALRVQSETLKLLALKLQKGKPKP